MSEWKEFSISQLAEIVGGGTPKTSILEYWNGNIPWLSVADFGGKGRYVYSTEKHITELGLKNSSTKILKKGELIISARGTVGELAQLKADMTFNQSCYGLCANEKTTNDFLYYLLKNSITNLKQNSNGGVFDTIIRETFNFIKVLIPEDIHEQKAIAEILSSIDDKIDLLNKQNKTLEEINSLYYNKIFFETNTNKKKLDTLVNVSSGKRPRSINDKRDIINYIPIIGASNIIGYTNEFNSEADSIIIGRVGTHGVVQRFDKNVWASDNTLVIETKYQGYVTQILKSIDYESINRGSTQPLITQGDMNNVNVFYNSINEIEEYEKFYDVNYKKIVQNKNQIENLNNLRDILLPKLISGEIRVKMEE